MNCSAAAEVGVCSSRLERSVYLGLCMGGRVRVDVSFTWGHRDAL